VTSIVPQLPINGQQLRATLLALEGQVGSGVSVPALPLTGAQIHAILVALEGAISAGGRILTGTTAPAVTDGANGDYWFRSTAGGDLTIYGPKAAGSWGAPVFAYDGGLPTPPPRRLLLESVRPDEFWPLDQVTEERTVARITAAVRGTLPSVTFSLLHGPVVGESGAELVTGGITVTGQAVVTELDSAVIPADDWIWFVTTATDGVVNVLNVGIEYG
jgi:hypothetical protein